MKLTKEKPLPCGTQRAGFCIKLITHKRSHEKEAMVYYCSVAKNDGSDRTLWEQMFYKLRNLGRELSYMTSATASTSRAR